MKTSIARRIRFLLPLLLIAAAFSLDAETSKVPVDPAAEARFGKYFGLAKGDYATPQTVEAALKQWFPPGTPLEKIRGKLGQPGDLKASWETVEGSKTLLWIVVYTHSDVWNGKAWTTNCFCVEVTFQFDGGDKLREIAARWIMFPL